MEKINLGYSIKNIPIPNERSYLLQLMEKIEAVIKRMRWKVLFHNKEDEKNDHIPETYGLKSDNCPAQIKELVPFESDLIQLIKNIKFRKVKNDFQKKLSKDIRDFKSSNKTLTPADKTSNMYELDKTQYDRLLQNAITATYKKTDNRLIHKINNSGKRFAKDVNILDKIEINGTSNCFITLKDHKDNFENNPTTRLINPAKNEVGRISKVVLDKMNKTLCQKLKVNQWKNTTEVVEWFKAIKNKSSYKFCMFDIKDFYPSIKESLLLDALNFARKHTKIIKKDIDLILHARRSLLFDCDKAWVKKTEEHFDVTMGAYDGAEVCELVGLYLLSLLGEKYNTEEIGLYRDDGLSVFKNISGPQAEKIKKDFQSTFKKVGLEIVVSCNMKVVNYLDVTLNLNNGSYKPYHKPNNEILYINKESNHPPSIIKQLPISIENRLSNLSSSEKVFKESASVYQEALNKCGYKHQLKYNVTPQKTNSKNNNRKRKIIWFNPPYSQSVVNNVGKYFLNLIDKHFPPHHKYRKLFNRNTVKISYSCMINVKNHINQHNRKVLTNGTGNSTSDLRKCNCLNAPDCPLDGKCLEKEVLYQGAVSTNLANYKEKLYKGICATKFKSRYCNHKKAFINERYRNDTELSKEVWNVREQNGTPKIKWSILGKYSSYNPISKRCNLCLNEKLEIAIYKGENLLNKRSEVISKCRHRNKYKLSNLTADGIT